MMTTYWFLEEVVNAPLHRLLSLATRCPLLDASPAALQHRHQLAEAAAPSIGIGWFYERVSGRLPKEGD